MERAAASLSATSSAAFADGLGERRLVADAAGRDTLEWLCIRPDLASVPSFEFALRERVSRLGAVRAPACARVRSVERLNDPDATLTLISEHIDGVRLSELLAGAERRGLALDINSALCLIRQLVNAVAALHETGRDNTHGALGPERLVVTSQGVLVVVEHVCGSAIEQLRYSHDRYWSELRVALPRTPGPARFDQRTDVLQIGTTALALVIGRLLGDEEFPSRLGELLASTWAVSARGGYEPLPAGLRGWLGRALQLDARNAFATAQEAQDEFETVVGPNGQLASPASLVAFLTKYGIDDGNGKRPAAPSVGRAPVAAPASRPMPVAESPRPVPISALLPPPPAEPQAASAPKPQSAPAPRSTGAAAPEFAAILAVPASPPPLTPAPAVLAPVGVEVAPPVSNPAFTMEPIAGSSGIALSHAAAPVAFDAAASTARDDERDAEEPWDEAEDEEAREGAASEALRRWRKPAAIAGVVIALAAVGVPAARKMFARPPAVPHTGTLVITSNPNGAATIVDGETRGMTPLTLTLAPGEHAVELQSAGSEPRTMSVTVSAGTETSQYIELPKSGPAAGQLHVRTDPPGAEVTVDGVPHGRTPALVSDLAAGEHTVVVSSDLGSTKQTVTVEAGATASLVVPLGAAAGAAPTSAWVAVSAPVELQVFEQDRLLGTSGGDRLPVAPGKHDLDFVNDALGYRATRTVQVGAGKTAAVKIDLPNGTIALNATPWAEVWIDGEKVGETPIGNVSVAIGPHDVVFRHPDLGERHQTAIVTLKEPTRLSVDMRSQR